MRPARLSEMSVREHPNAAAANISDRSRHQPIGRPPQVEPVGTRARRLQRKILRADRSIAGRWWLVFHLVLKPLHNLLRIVPQVVRIAPKAKHLYGISIRRQIIDQIRLVLFHGATPWVYYVTELYRGDAMRHAGELVMRNAMKHGVWKALNRIDPEARDHGRSLGDKLKTAAWCAEAGLPHPQPLIVIERGDAIWLGGSLGDLDRDLFVKPRHGRGANGVARYRRTHVFEYLDDHDRAVNLKQLVVRLVRQSHRESLLVQPLLRTHPALADLTGDSLITLRVFTCLDEDLRPVVTNAFLRSLAKLEPRWKTGRIEEFAAPIDLETGTLGRMTGDKPECLSDWSDRHPMTGALVTGRIVPFWPELARLAIEAHGMVAERIVVGWDIAATETGPVLLEGNSYPDTIYPQRLFRKPIGHMRLGELLNFHMGRLEARLDQPPKPELRD